MSEQDALLPRHRAATSYDAAENGSGTKAAPRRGWLPTFFFNIFFACVGFSIIMPSLAPYLMNMGASLAFLPWVVSVYAIGEMIGSVMFGWLYERLVDRLAGGAGPRAAMLSCIAVGIVGSAMYVTADWVNSKWMVFWARAVQGLWTGGQQTIEQAYLSAAVEQKKRVELTATLSTFAVLGFIMGPSFGAMFSTVHTTFMGVRVDPYNAPGLFILAMTLAMFAVTYVTFDGKEARGGASAAGAARGDADGAGAAAGRRPGDKAGARRSYLGLGVCLWLFFVHYYSFAVQETITTPLVLRLYAWTPLGVNLLFVGAGVLSLATSVSVRYLSRVFEDRTLLVASLLAGLLGSALLIDAPSGEGPLALWRFFAGFALITVAFPFGRNVTLGVFSNVLGPGPQGRWMGVMLAVGAVPRILGPFSAMAALDLAGWHTWLEFGSTALLFVVGLGCALAFLQSLLPYPEHDPAARTPHRGSMSPRPRPAALV